MQEEQDIKSLVARAVDLVTVQYVSITKACQITGVSRSSYYKHRDQIAGGNSQKDQKDSNDEPRNK